MAYECAFNLAERVGFEPTRPFGLTDFELSLGGIMGFFKVSQCAYFGHCRENPHKHWMQNFAFGVDLGVDFLPLIYPSFLLKMLSMALAVFHAA